MLRCFQMASDSSIHTPLLTSGENKCFVLTHCKQCIYKLHDCAMSNVMSISNKERYIHIFRHHLYTNVVLPVPLKAIQGLVPCPKTQRQTRMKRDLNSQPVGYWTTSSPSWIHSRTQTGTKHDLRLKQICAQTCLTFTAKATSLDKAAAALMESQEEFQLTLIC